MDKKTAAVSLLFFVGMCLLFIGLFKTSLAHVKSDVPLVNDAWYDAMQAIKEDSENNPGQPWEKAIITSWWDFGHHFKYLSDRGVTFDGGTQVTPQAHWVGKLFLTSDEDISRNILRMLDCGGNKAFDNLNDKLNDAPMAINILNQLLKAKRMKEYSELEKTYVGGFVVNDVSYLGALASYMGCNPTSGYVIASEDMVGKAGVWAHFGSWDFNRADMWINVKKMQRQEAVKYMLDKEYAETEDQAVKLWLDLQRMTESEANNWIAPWPGYVGGQNCAEQNGSVVCGDAVIRGENIETSRGPPVSFVYVKDGKVVEKRYDNSTLGVSIIYSGDRITLSSPELANSLFTKLFFFDGAGLEHFKLFKQTQNIDGFKIKVYEVQWQ